MYNDSNLLACNDGVPDLILCILDFWKRCLWWAMVSSQRDLSQIQQQTGRGGIGASGVQTWGATLCPEHV